MIQRRSPNSIRFAHVCIGVQQQLHAVRSIVRAGQMQWCAVISSHSHNVWRGTAFEYHAHGRGHSMRDCIRQRCIVAVASEVLIQSTSTPLDCGGDNHLVVRFQRGQHDRAGCVSFVFLNVSTTKVFTAPCGCCKLETRSSRHASRYNFLSSIHHAARQVYNTVLERFYRRAQGICEKGRSSGPWGGLVGKSTGSAGGGAGTRGVPPTGATELASRSGAARGGPDPAPRLTDARTEKRKRKRDAQNDKCSLGS